MAANEEPRTLEEAMARKNIGKLQDLAARIGCAPRSLSAWIHGEHCPSAYYLGRLSHVLGTDARQFFPSTRQPAPTISRRSFVAGIAALPVTLALPQAAMARHAVSNQVVQSLEVIAYQYRALQRNGVGGLDDGLRGHAATIMHMHAATIMHMLEATINDQVRRDLWRVLALTQLLARLNITKQNELGQAKTWNEEAIASAQQSGDATLLAAAVGHLAHLTLMWQHDVPSAYQLAEEAKTRVQHHSALQGWLSILSAAIAAKENNRIRCEREIALADEHAHALPPSEANCDPFFTDFSIASVDAFAGNCLINVEEPTKGYERLTAINLGDLAHNRHASTFYDISRAYAAAGELQAAEVYAVQAIDSAVATSRTYIIPRFLKLAEAIQQRDRSNAHAAAIAQYAREALYH